MSTKTIGWENPQKSIKKGEIFVRLDVTGDEPTHKDMLILFGDWWASEIEAYGADPEIFLRELMKIRKKPMVVTQ
jgi:hypothetical protein